VDRGLGREARGVTGRRETRAIRGIRAFNVQKIVHVQRLDLKDFPARWALDPNPVRVRLKVFNQQSFMAADTNNFSHDFWLQINLPEIQNLPVSETLKPPFFSFLG
jgi:hypothetical protein